MIDNALQIDGWMSPTELQWLADKAKECSSIIEVGSYLGRSTTALCENTEGMVIAVDPYKGDYQYQDGSVMRSFGNETYETFKKNLWRHLDSGKLIQYRTTLPQLKNHINLDMIFLDGDHRYEVVKEDILAALPLLKRGGIISGHDYTHSHWPGVKQAVDELLGSVQVTDSIWWTKIW